MLRSDWLSYYWAICYSPLVAKSVRHICQAQDVLSRYFFDQLLGCYQNNVTNGASDKGHARIY